MGFPDPIEDEDTPGSGSGPSKQRSSPEDANRPDWLVGAEEGAEAEHEARSSSTSFELRRPDGQAPQSRRPPQDEPEETGRAKAWTGAASSVPRLQEARRASLAPRATFSPHDEEEIADGEFPDDGEPQGQAGSPRRVAKPLQEAWWVVWLDALTSDRRVQLIVLGSLLGVLALVIVWPRGEQGVALRQIRKTPQAYANQTVRVNGRVGEVFEMGGGYVFHLLQGRDTLVVFTRFQRPAVHERISVVGTVSTGYLDGTARLALFESSAR